MKSFSVSLIIAFFLLNVGQSQISLGLTGGINVSGAKVDSASDLFKIGNRTGYFLGLLPKYNVTDKLAIIGETQLSIKGNKQSSPSEIYEQNLKYLNFLPGVEFELLEIIRLGIGVNFAYLIDESQRLNGGSWQDVDLVKDVDLGLNGTVKVQVSNIFGFVRYELGLNEASNITYTDINGNPIGALKTYNRNIQIGVGLKLL